jgi:hypothetical protein
MFPECVHNLGEPQSQGALKGRPEMSLSIEYISNSLRAVGFLLGMQRLFQIFLTGTISLWFLLALAGVGGVWAAPGPIEKAANPIAEQHSRLLSKAEQEGDVPVIAYLITGA